MALLKAGIASFDHKDLETNFKSVIPGLGGYNNNGGTIPEIWNQLCVSTYLEVATAVM